MKIRCWNVSLVMFVLACWRACVRIRITFPDNIENDTIHNSDGIFEWKSITASMSTPQTPQDKMGMAQGITPRAKKRIKDKLCKALKGLKGLWVEGLRGVKEMRGWEVIRIRVRGWLDWVEWIVTVSFALFRAPENSFAWGYIFNIHFGICYWVV